MPATRTSLFEVDDTAKDFEASLEVCKATVDQKTGKRYLEGVATGVLEDADGERVSTNAIRKMARQAVSDLKLTSSHQQDWATEIGDVARVSHDPETDELLVKCELPPEGEDPLADKAWLRQTVHGEKLAFSIGGKLRHFFFEKNEVGKRRKVLDDIDLRHFMLTKKPAYRDSFALAVAKSLSEPPDPADDAFDREVEVEPREAIVIEKVLVEKDASAVSQDPEQEGPGGAKGKKKVERDVNADQNDETTAPEDLPKARRLACPSCGHEFAADMPADTEPPAEGGRESDREAHKTAPEENDMSDKAKADDVLASIRELVTQDEAVEKTDPETPAAAGEPVEKTPTETTDIEKMLAASHKAHKTAIEELAEKTADSLQIVAKAVKGIQEAVASTPQGRRSLARVTEGSGLPTRAEVEAGEVAKTRTTDDDIEKQIEEEEDPVKALRILNARDYRVPSTGVEVPAAA